MKIRLIVIAATCVAYTLLDLLNHYVFRALEFKQMVHWIYLPSGLRLAFVLIFAAMGAIGVALGSALIGFLHYFAHDPMTALLTGMGSGLAPYLARYACHDWLNMDLELRNLTPGKLLAISVVFAVMSASLQQAVLLWRGYTDHFAQDTFVMASGDLLGTIIVIYLAKLTILAVGAGLKSR